MNFINLLRYSRIMHQKAKVTLTNIRKARDLRSKQYYRNCLRDTIDTDDNSSHGCFLS